MDIENEIWRECTKWLTRCGALRPDHKLNWSDSTIADFAYTLRDGVLLCNLLNILDSESFDMKDVNQKPQMAQFLCLRNIKTFLQACQELYGLQECDLFEPSMLFDLSDFYKVMNTLSRLSNCPKLRKKGIPGFSIPKLRTPSQEDIYRNLNAGEVTTGKCTVGGTDVEFGAYDNHIHNEEVYHDLCSIKKRNTLLSQIPVAVVPSIEKRDYVINELIETEKNYVDVLNTLQKSFMRPLKNCISEDDYATIFFGINELAEIHTGFHVQLRKACTPCSTQRLSEVFLGWRQRFIIYGDYCANLTSAESRILEICSKNEVIKQEVDRCQQEANNSKFKLRDLLFVPMQRILKYHLLLDKLLQETQPHHEDFRGLERAKEAMVDVAEYINEVKRDSDTLHIIDNIQQAITDWTMTEKNTYLKDFGRLLKDGEVKVKCSNDPKTRLRYVFVFDQILLMCKLMRGETYSLKEMLHLNEYKIEEITRRTVSRETSARWNHSFNLIYKFESNNVTYTFCLKTEDSRRKWVKALQDALDNIEPASARHTEHKFLFQTFDKPSVCNYCSKFLKGRIFQGYKCTNCGIAVHKACIVNSNRCGTRHQPEIPPRPPFGSLASRSPLSPNCFTPLDGQLVDWGREWSDKDFLSEHLWFVGEMGRDQATNLLEQEIDGTFLVRIRPQGPTHTNESAFALSLKTDGKVKHMKVYEKKVNGSSNYYLSESRFFPSLIDLISCYEQTSLGENFMGLNVRLQWPFRRIMAVAEFDFNPSEPNQLPLKKGCQVLVLSKEGDHKGWWKGQINDRIGFFPKVYVREISDTFQMNRHM
ncbi:protein vav isoform X2 [Planococcus citri]|uniref:protein vav isoform X2 n=1 Tax=Planococcus citri TaxID=170843 RepID=UPI0031F9CFB2